MGERAIDRCRAAWANAGLRTYPDGRVVHRSPDKRFRQSGNTKGRSLFHADRIGDAQTVYVVEGEKDVHAVESAGGAAVCSAMGAGKAHLADWTPLHGKTVIIVADKDKPGRAHAQAVAKIPGSDLRGQRCRHMITVVAWLCLIATAPTNPHPMWRNGNLTMSRPRKDAATTPGEIANAMDRAEEGRRAPTGGTAKTTGAEMPPVTAYGTGAPPGGPPKPPMSADAGDGWDELMDHVWMRHAPEALHQEGTKFPRGTTREKVAAMIRDIISRERVTAPIGPVAPEFKARLDAGEVTLAEERARHLNLYGLAEGVRYQVRLAGADSTAHPIDGKGIVRHRRDKDGRMTETKMPLGRRPVVGWDRPKSR